MEITEQGASSVGIIVAHPDDEILWAGGTLLLHREWRCRIHTLCRASDTDRAPKFSRILAHLGAEGGMADLDDAPEQSPLASATVQQAILALLDGTPYDLLLTHGPCGEYTWHQRHVDVSQAVAALWQAGTLTARELWMFAYEDGQRAYLPQAIATADIQVPLPEDIWQHKYHLIHDIYGFSTESWEARATPRQEAFWRFRAPEALADWLQNMEVQR